MIRVFSVFIRFHFFLLLAFICASCGNTYQPNNTSSTDVISARQNINSQPIPAATVNNTPSISSNPVNIKFRFQLYGEDKIVKASSPMKYSIWIPQIGRLVKPYYQVQEYCISDKPVIDVDFRYYGTDDINHVCFSINENLVSESAPEPIKPGTYLVNIAPGKIGAVSSVKLRMRHDGGKISFYTMDVSKGEGSVSIEYADATRIKGRIDVLDQNLSISGEFDAAMQKKPADINPAGY